jgi:hypothetical protein
MDRIELDEELDLEAYEKKQFKPLDLGKIAPLSRFKVKPASNINHERNKALAQEIRELWAIPIPRMMRTIKLKGYQFIWECYNECKKSNARNPAALFQWKLKQVKVPLQ